MSDKSEVAKKSKNFLTSGEYNVRIISAVRLVESVFAWVAKRHVGGITLASVDFYYTN